MVAGDRGKFSEDAGLTACHTHSPAGLPQLAGYIIILTLVLDVLWYINVSHSSLASFFWSAAECGRIHARARNAALPKSMRRRRLVPKREVLA